MPREYKTKSQKPYKKHNPLKLKQAVDDVKNNILSLRKSSEKYGMHHSVIYRHLKKGGAIKNHGGQTCLSESDEKILVDRLIICCEWGYPIDTMTLRMIVQEFLNRQGKQVKRFKDNLPGKEFVYSFLRRHKQALSHRLCQNIKRNRAAVSPEIINEYFDRLQEELAGVPPQNIINYDETNLCDDPGRKKIISKRGCKYPERLMNSTKSSISVMFSAAGDGTILPVYVVYKAIHLYQSWTDGGPKGTRYNRTKSGWFDRFCFEDWLVTIAIPYLKKQSGKRILIGDNLSSHLTAEAIKLCNDKEIKMVFLPSNSTHLTQPLDVAFFHPLKVSWRKILDQWKSGPGSREAALPKDKFPRLLNQLMTMIAEHGSINVQSGFRKCGIVPLDRSPVLQRLPSTPDNTGQTDSTLDQSFVELLKKMRYEDSSTPIRKKRTRLQVVPGKSVEAVESESSESSVHMSLHDTDSSMNMMEIDSCDEDDENVSSIVTIKKIYPHPITKEEIRQGDWLVVNFFLNSNKPGTSFSNKKPYIGQVKAIIDDSFQGEFYRQRNTKDFPGLIYGLPDVQDIAEFDFGQVVGKLNPPVDHGRGLKKFDIAI